MIFLTDAQQKTAAGGDPVRLEDNGQEFVLLRADVYERLADYDDSPWTSTERQALAWQAGKRAGWDAMDEYDDYPETQ